MPGIFVKKVEKSYVTIESALFLMLRLLIVSITDLFFCSDKNDLIPER